MWNNLDSVWHKLGFAQAYLKVALASKLKESPTNRVLAKENLIR
jgi:hypothetical protein